ncbi:MAG: MBOAT family O-acyltransferase [Anaerolineales bacterium]
MSITSPLFFACAALFILAHWKLPPRLRLPWLLLGSMAFLATWSWQFILVLLVVTAVNYGLGLRLAGPRKRLILWAGILFNLGVLLFFKYHRFYAPALSAFLSRLGIAAGTGALGLLMPVGLSFLTIQFISYLVDVSQGRIPPEKDALVFALYGYYFPKLLSGPIERAGEFFGRLRAPAAPSGERLTRSLSLILVGLARKVLLADSLNALLPADLFENPGLYPGPLLAVWLLAYAFALYNDFAGYTGIVRGVSALLGIDLNLNFRVPYFARNFTEFWTRWHISLSNWLRDYIFFPCSRFLLKRFPRRSHPIHILLPPLLTMLVSGLWHGLSWNMLLWGGVHGLYLILERVISLVKGRRAPGELPGGLQVLSALGVFACVALAWLPFRMDATTALQYLQGLLSPANWPLAEYKIYLARFVAAYRYSPETWMPWILPLLQTAAFVLPGLFLDRLQYRDEFAFLKWKPWLQGLTLALLALALLLLALTDTGAPFIYQGF